MRPLARTLIKVAAGGVGLTLAAGAVIHLPPVMAYLKERGHDGGGICPLGYTERAKHVAVAPPQDGKPRPALGFALGTTTTADVQAWSRTHGVACVEGRRGATVSCENVPSALLGEVAAPPASLMFSIDSANVVRSLQVTRRAPEVTAVTAAFTGLTQQLAMARGAPTQQTGSAEPSDLARGALRQAMVEFRASDYRAVLRATNMGDGFVLTEQYALVN